MPLCLRLVAQSYLTLCNPLDYSLPVPSVHRIFQARNTGVGCHFHLQIGLPTLSFSRLFIRPPPSYPLGLSSNSIFSKMVFLLEWVAMSSSRGSSQPRDWICISYLQESCIGRQVLYHYHRLGFFDHLI